MQNYWRLEGRQLIVLSLVPILLGLSALALGLRWYQETGSFLENLRQVEGNVVRMEPAESGFRAQVVYLGENGIRYEREFPVEGNREAAIRATGKVTVVHDARDPNQAELGDVVSASNEHRAAAAILWAGVVAMAFGLTCFIRLWRRIAEIGRLFRSGQIAQTEVRDQTIQPGRNIGRFTYAFRGTDGRWYDGKSPEMPPDRLAEWPVGRPLQAAFDVRNPRRSEPDVFGVIPARRQAKPKVST